MLFEHRVLFIVPFELGVASIGKQKFLFRLTPRRVESWYHNSITATYSLITGQSQNPIFFPSRNHARPQSDNTICTPQLSHLNVVLFHAPGQASAKDKQKQQWLHE